jgi:multidrug efflux pump subunit AcrA (membrane-fusion protein)
MNRIVIVLGIVFALILSGCATKTEPTVAPGAQDDFNPVVSVTGELVPATWAALGAKAGGRVSGVLVEPGDAVDEDAPLVRLDTTDLGLSLRVAQQEVAAQQATLARLIAGASESSAARADRENAQQVAQAEIALKVKQRQLEQALARDPAKEVAAAQALVQQLQAQLAQVRAQDPAAEVRLAQVELERNKIALDDAQNEYNKALDRPWEDQGIRDAWAKELEQMQLNHRAAQAELDAAVSTQRAHALSQNALLAQIAEAQVRLEQAQEAERAYGATLDILGDEVDAARLALEHLQAWENPLRDKAMQEEIDQVEARLEQAQWTVAQIEQQIADAELRAPFAGTVGSVDVRAGELVVSGQPLLTLGDLDTLRVETTDLDEIDVVQVAVGQEAAVTFDALPDRVITGVVTRISPMAESGSGGVNYTVVLELAEVDPVLRWGMTAFVDIEVD